jgi:hypothetical protein
MKSRARAIRIRLFWLDILVAMVLLVGGIEALVHWPDKTFADVAIPLAILLVFMVGRER